MSCLKYKNKDNIFVIGNKRVSILSDILFRIEKNDNGIFEDRPTFLIQDRQWTGCSVEWWQDDDEDENGLNIKTDSFTLFIPYGDEEDWQGWNDEEGQEKNCNEKPVDQDGNGEENSHEEGNNWDEEEAFYDCIVYDNDGNRLFNINIDDIDKKHQPLSDAHDKDIYILPDKERVVPPSWKSLPPHNTVKGESMSKEPVGWEIESAGDIYIFVHQGDPDRLREEFLRLTGKIPLPPRWAFGFWNSLYHAYSDKEALEIIDRYRKEDIPLDVFVVDTDWRVGGSAGYDIETKYFPNIKEFFKEAHDRHVKIIMNDHPSPRGMDPIEPELLQYRYDNLTNFLDMGLDVWWYDKNWHEFITGPTEEIATEIWGQYLYWNAVEHFKPGIRPMLLSMWSHHPSSHRYPIWWTGDILSTWQELKQGVKDTLYFGMNCMPYVGQDLGGHMGHPPGELYLRFLQYGCLSPTTRVHGTVGTRRYPWQYGHEILNISREYIKLRYRLLPTIYSYARECYDTGIPLLRTTDKEFSQYLLGEDLLVVPVCSPKEKGEKVKVRLPQGEWECLWSGEIFIGEKEIEIESPLYKIPLFIKRPGILFLSPDMNYTDEKPLDPVVIEVFPSTISGSSINRYLYEDDGITTEYQQGGFRKTKIRLSAFNNRTDDGKYVEIDINCFGGKYKGMSQGNKIVRVHLHPHQKAEEIIINERVLNKEEYSIITPKTVDIKPQTGKEEGNPPFSPPLMPLRGTGSTPGEKAGVIVEIPLSVKDYLPSMETEILLKVRDN